MHQPKKVVARTMLMTDVNLVLMYIIVLKIIVGLFQRREMVVVVTEDIFHWLVMKSVCQPAL
jgi:hypothetical protein